MEKKKSAGLSAGLTGGVGALASEVREGEKEGSWAATANWARLRLWATKKREEGEKEIGEASR